MTVIDLVHVISRLLPEPHAGLLSGILFGTKATLSPEFTDALITTGTIHIVALSGMNITILSNIAVRTLLYQFSRRVSSLLTLLIIIGYVLFVGVSASVVRAALMGSLSLIGVVTGRQVWPIWSLMITGLIMIIVRPDWLIDVGFQLSFLATLGILLFGGSTNDMNMSHASDQHSTLMPQAHNQAGSSFYVAFWNFIRDDLRVTLAAQVFTLPLILVLFQRVSIISPIANIAIGWLIAPLTIVGMCMILGFFLFPPLGTVLSWIIWTWLTYLIWIVQTLSSLPFAAVVR